MRKKILLVASWIVLATGNVYAAYNDSDLRAYWPFINDYTDKSGNDLTLVEAGNGQISLSSGVFNSVTFSDKCADFSGNTDAAYSYLEYSGNNQALDLDTEASFAFWIKPTGMKPSDPKSFTDRMIILNKEYTYEIGLNASYQLKYAFWYKTNPSEWRWVTTSVTCPKDTWTHIALVFNAEGVRIYKNGILEYTGAHVAGSGGIRKTDYNFRIGSRQGYSADYFVGMLDEIRIYSRALSPAEIVALKDTPYSEDNRTILYTNDFSSYPSGWDIIDAGQNPSMTVLNLDESASLTFSASSSDSCGTGATELTITLPHAVQVGNLVITMDVMLSGTGEDIFPRVTIVPFFNGARLQHGIFCNSSLMGSRFKQLTEPYVFMNSPSGKWTFDLTDIPNLNNETFIDKIRIDLTGFACGFGAACSVQADNLLIEEIVRETTTTIAPTTTTSIIPTTTIESTTTTTIESTTTTTIMEQQCTDSDNDDHFAEGGACGEKDCNDNDALVYPGAEEVCNDGKDNNCDGYFDEECGLDCQITTMFPLQVSKSAGGAIFFITIGGEGCKNGLALGQILSTTVLFVGPYNDKDSVKMVASFAVNNIVLGLLTVNKTAPLGTYYVYVQGKKINVSGASIVVTE